MAGGKREEGSGKWSWSASVFIRQPGAGVGGSLHQPTTKWPIRPADNGPDGLDAAPAGGWLQTIAL